MDAAARRATFALAACAVVAHVLTARDYGIFRDELYYLACADHLDWGYVDHPPLSILALRLFTGVFGDSVVALRILPALLHGLVVLATGRLTWVMGARGIGVAVAATCAALAPGFMALTSFYSMNALDLGFHAAAMLVFAEILVRPSGRGWLSLGLVVGLGLQNKYSVGLLAAGFAAGYLVTRHPVRALRSRWPWIAMVIAAVAFVPHLAWQAAHGWPTREFIANAQRFKMSALAPPAFLAEVLLEMNPLSVLVWAAGGIALLVWPPLRVMRPLGVAWCCVCATLLVERSKPYYLGATFPILFAAGGVVWERIGTRLVWAPRLVITLLALSGLLVLPYAIPVLPPTGFIAYNGVLRITPESGENHEMGPLPQLFADRFGWKEMAEAMAGAYHALPPEERKRCVILARNYGEAGALAYYGRQLGLPYPVSQHNSFYLWGPGEGRSFDLVLSIGQDAPDLLEAFESVEEVARFDHPFAMPYERNAPIYLCRRLRLPLEAAWRAGKLFI